MVLSSMLIQPKRPTRTYLTRGSRLRGTAREVSFQRKVPGTNAKPSFGILGCTKARPFLDGTRRTEMGWTIYFFGPNTFQSQSVNSQMKVLRAFRLMGLTLVF